MPAERRATKVRCCGRLREARFSKAARTAQRAQHAQHGLGLVDRGGADEQRAARGPAARDGARDLDVLVLNAIVVVYVDC